jgi:hypothetical protein
MIPMRKYRYVGPQHIAGSILPDFLGTLVELPEDVYKWIRSSDQELNAERHVIATYIVDEDGRVRIADRSSEHVACAGGRLVQSAGEITFNPEMGSALVIAVSNQSAGYCPEPEAWHATRSALSAAGLRTPENFDPVCVFRR